MTGVATPPKNPDKVRAGRIGGRTRWHLPRVVDISDLSGEQRRLVLAMIEAARRGPDDAP